MPWSRVDPALAQLVWWNRCAASASRCRGGCRRESALVVEIVDREQRAGPRTPGPTSSGPSRERRERGLPVVGVDHVGGELQPAAALEGGAGQHEEPEMLVGIAGVERRAVIQRRAVHEVDRRVARPTGTEDRNFVLPITEPDLDVAQHGLDAGAAQIELCVVRQKDSYVVTRAEEKRRQRRRYVGQAARLGIARDLGRDVQNVHVLRIIARPGSSGPSTFPGCGR